MPGGASCEAGWRTEEGRTVTRKLTGNGVWIVPAGRLHSLAWNRDAEMIVLYLDREWIRPFTPGSMTDVSVEPLSRYVAQAPLIGEICQEFHALCREENPLADHVTALGVVLATKLVSAHCGLFPRGPKCWAILPVPMRRLLDYIEQNLAGDLSTPALARVAGLSESYLGEVFRDYTGLTPQPYVMRQRVIRAKRLLRTGEHTVGEVAHLVGFSDQPHMDRHFREMCNAPPSAYLPQGRGNGRRGRWKA
ncbi:DNA-binding domain-containing protein, AraC-type [Opitutaceae bacterium TAV1]|nr:DNA-binding domain-containing protein, AraC-type [Opitutaceae bacterium TAV1]